MARPLAETDLDALAAIAADPQVMVHVGDGVPLSRAATALWISNAGASVRLSGIGSRARGPARHRPADRLGRADPDVRASIAWS